MRRAKRTEVLLGVVLGTRLLGLAVLTVRFRIGPRPGQTVLSQIMRASVGRGVIYYVVSLTVTVALSLAANTSFGGLPVLSSLLAGDNFMPHVFGLRADPPVYRYGVVSLGVLAGVLLIAVNGNTITLIPLYAVGVFTGFTLSQAGLVRHWHKARLPRWRARAAINATGAAMTGMATIVFLVTKFAAAGGWVVVLAIPALMLLFHRIDIYYAEVGKELGLGVTPGPPAAAESLVVVALSGVSRLSKDALSTAMSLGDTAVAVSVAFDDDRVARLQVDWDRWNPGVPLVVLRPVHRSIAGPMVGYLCSPEVQAHAQVMVLIPEVEPGRWRRQLLQNQRGVILAAVLRRRG